MGTRTHTLPSPAALIVLALGSFTLASAAPRSQHFGREWVRSHPLTIMGQTLRAESVADNKYSDCGFTAMFAWEKPEGILASAVRQGLIWHKYLHEDTAFDDAAKADIQRLVETYPGAAGFMVWDEPERPELEEVGKRVAWLKQHYPDLLVYSKAYCMVWGGNGVLLDRDSAAKQYGGKWLDSGVYDEPPVPYTYEEFLHDYVTTVKPDVLCVDIYPFIRPPEGDSEQYLSRNFFKNLSAVRKAALEADIPYWSFVQAYEHTGGGGRRYPSESDLRMQVFTTLAYGYTGVMYYCYDHVSDRGLLKGVPGEPTELYYAAQKLNGEIARLGQSLRYLTSTDVRYIRGTHPPDEYQRTSNPPPDGLGIYHPKSRVADQVTDITISPSNAQTNGLIGFFSDDDDGRYFMLVNLTHGEGRSAADASASITLTLSDSVKSLYQLSRETGRPKRVTLDGHRVRVTIPGGTGELFRINQGTFAGINGSAD